MWGGRGSLPDLTLISKENSELAISKSPTEKQLTKQEKLSTAQTTTGRSTPKISDFEILHSQKTRFLTFLSFGNIEIFKNPDFSVVVTNNSYVETIFLKNCLCSDNFLVIEVVASFEGYLIDFCVIEVELPDV